MPVYLVGKGFDMDQAETLSCSAFPQGYSMWCRTLFFSPSRSSPFFDKYENSRHNCDQLSHRGSGWWYWQITLQARTERQVYLTKKSIEPYIFAKLFLTYRRNAWYTGSVDDDSMWWSQLSQLPGNGCSHLGNFYFRVIIPQYLWHEKYLFARKKQFIEFCMFFHLQISHFL